MATNSNSKWVWGFSNGTYTTSVAPDEPQHAVQCVDQQQETPQLMRRVAMHCTGHLLHDEVQQMFADCKPAVVAVVVVVGTVSNTIIARRRWTHGKFIWPHFAARFAICRNQLNMQTRRDTLRVRDSIPRGWVAASPSIQTYSELITKSQRTTGLEIL